MIYTHSRRLALISSMSFPLLSNTTAVHYHEYEIEDIRQSENAWLLFTRDNVIKMLRPYKDTRYSLATLRERQICLLEGLKWNRVFTSGIHMGLAPVCHWNPDKKIIGIGNILETIGIGNSLESPTLRDLDLQTEYVLVMCKLPKNNRLDCLLNDGNSISHQYYKQALTQFLLHIHMDPIFPIVSSDNTHNWGSIDQLKKKLLENLGTVVNPQVRNKEIVQGEHFKMLQAICKSLKETLLPLFAQPEYQKYFQQRVDKQQIKRCHGDLKARNIWIMPSSQDSSTEIWDGVRVLDAIDFNASFCNIDTLSDFAMLVADIHTRTKSQNLANQMMEEYLHLTKQHDKASRFVLNYYLVEKAFVGALVNIMYDELPEVGLAYLDVTRKYLEELRRHMIYMFSTASGTTQHG